ncbi:MAG TPA: glutathione S-transferase family protein [Rhizomicrobium sp.]|nr:glutathione S-transferase family protein [Rhizomicrobium sp.]
MALILYGSNLSPFVRKVRVVLIEKGIDYTLDQVNPFRQPPEFAAISPLKRIPVLRDTDLPEPNTLPDSSVISDYLENKFPEPALYPKSHFARARALWFEEYVDSGVFPVMGAGLFFERVVKKFQRGVTDQALCARTIEESLPPLFDYLESEIRGKSYFVDERFTIADVAVASVMANYRHSGEALNAARWPHFAAYVEKILARPSFQTVLAEEQKLIDIARSR